MVRGDRRNAAPVVDARVEQATEVVAQVRRRLQVDVGRQDHARQCDRVEVLVLGTRRGAVHRGAPLGKEVLDDDLLHVSVPRVRSRDLVECRDAVMPVLADADEDARREGDAQLARGLERGQPARRRLVR